jgi:hypothetical protein
MNARAILSRFAATGVVSIATFAFALESVIEASANCYECDVVWINDNYGARMYGGCDEINGGVTECADSHSPPGGVLLFCEEGEILCEVS